MRGRLPSLSTVSTRSLACRVCSAHASAEIFPTRTSQLDWKRWVAAGYDEEDSKEMMATLKQGLNHPNLATAVRVATTCAGTCAPRQPVQLSARTVCGCTACGDACDLLC